MNSKIPSFVPALALAALLVSSAASSQQARSGGGASEQLVQQLQQLASERTDLQAQNATLQKNLEDARKQVDSLKQQLTEAKSGSARSQAQLVSALTSAREAAQAARDNGAKSIADTRGKMQELIDRFRETVVTLRQTEADRAQARQQVIQTRSELDKCAQRNVDISKLTDDVLDRYQHQGVFAYVARAEPFTQLKRTQVANLVLEDRQRVEDLRVKETIPAAPGSPGPGGVQFRTNSDGR